MKKGVKIRKNFGPKTWLVPMPVLIIASYDEKGTANAMNVAWGGISEYEEISICISKEHKTTQNILLSKAFTISFATENFVKECDYVGIVSAHNIPNKLEKINFTTKKSDFVNAPIINQLPMTLECKFLSYDEKTEILKGKIINISASEEILENNKISLEKLKPIIFNPINNSYYVVGKKIGDAFKEGKKIDHFK